MPALKGDQYAIFRYLRRRVLHQRLNAGKQSLASSRDGICGWRFSRVSSNVFRVYCTKVGRLCKDTLYEGLRDCSGAAIGAHRCQNMVHKESRKTVVRERTRPWDVRASGGGFCRSLPDSSRVPNPESVSDLIGRIPGRRVRLILDLRSALIPGA